LQLLSTAAPLAKAQPLPNVQLFILNIEIQYVDYNMTLIQLKVKNSYKTNTKIFGNPCPMELLQILALPSTPLK